MSKARRATGPVMRIGEVWRQVDLIPAMHVGRATFARWRREGLKPLTDDSDALFLSDDVIAFLRQRKKEV